MFPVALVVGVWLWFAASRKATLWWGMTVVAGYSIVAASKILYKGWGIGLDSLNIAVFSGHAMNACLVLTVALSLLSRQWDSRLQWPAAGLGLVTGWWFSVHFVSPCMHPLPEALAGALVGSTAACVFLYQEHQLALKPVPVPILLFGCFVLALSASAPKYTAESLLNRLAISISGARQAYQTPH